MRTMEEGWRGRVCADADEMGVYVCFGAALWEGTPGNHAQLPNTVGTTEPAATEGQPLNMQMDAHVLHCIQSLVSEDSCPQVPANSSAAAARQSLSGSFYAHFLAAHSVGSKSATP